MRLQKYDPTIDDTPRPHATFAEMVPYQAGDWVKVEDLKNLLEEIREEFPTGFDHAKDGRYVWPDRWQRLEKLIDGNGDHIK